jgi:hypothetical protein
MYAEFFLVLVDFQVEQFCNTLEDVDQNEAILICGNP